MRSSITGIVTVLAFILISINVAGQGTCENALYKANNLYKEGKIRDAVNLLEPCVGEIGNSDDQFEAYRLLGIAYHDLNEEAKRDDYIRLMLKNRPDYQNQPNNDPSEFTRKVRQFKVEPKVYAGLAFGMNWNQVNLVKSYSAFAYPQVYNVTSGYQFGVTGEYMLNPMLGIGAGVMILGTSIDHHTMLEGRWHQDYSERLQFISPSLSIRKRFDVVPRVRVLVGLNAGTAIMTQSRAYVVSDYNAESTVEQYTKDALAERNKIQPNFGVLIGAKYQLQKGLIGLEAGYNIFTRNTVNDAKRYDDTEFIFNTQYVNDDLNMRMMSFNLTYNFPLRWFYQVSK